MKPIAKEDLVSAILQNQVTRLHQQLEAAKLELSQGSVNTSSAMASSLSSVPVVSAGTSSDTVEEEFSMLDGRLLVLPESEGGPSVFQLGRPASGSEGSGGGGGVSDGVGGVNSSDAITLGASSQREKGVVDVGTQTPSNMDTSRSCDSLYTMQLPGQTDSVWRSEETLVRMTAHRSVSCQSSIHHPILFILCLVCGLSVCCVLQPLPTTLFCV